MASNLLPVVDNGKIIPAAVPWLSEEKGVEARFGYLDAGFCTVVNKELKIMILNIAYLQIMIMHGNDINF